METGRRSGLRKTGSCTAHRRVLGASSRASHLLKLPDGGRRSSGTLDSRNRVVCANSPPRLGTV